MDGSLIHKGLELYKKFVSSETLKRHSFQVARCMEHYAGIFGEDAELWFTTGLVHDIDYDFASGIDQPDGHPYKGVEILKQNMFPDILINAVLAHADYTNTPRTSLLAKCLYAVDELSGFINSCARVHPSKSFESLTVEFVQKRMKEKSFSKNISREHLQRASQELGIDFEKHVENCIKALSTVGVFEQFFAKHQDNDSQY